MLSHTGGGGDGWFPPLSVGLEWVISKSLVEFQSLTHRRAFKKGWRSDDFAAVTEQESSLFFETPSSILSGVVKSG